MHDLIQGKSMGNGNMAYTARVRKCGNALFLSQYGQPFQFDLTAEERQQNLNRIIRSLDPTNPNPPIAVELITKKGSFEMDLSMVIEFGAELLLNTVTEDLGDLLIQYPPLN